MMKSFAQFCSDTMDFKIRSWVTITGYLDQAGQWLPGLVLRLIMFWEFWESGVEKYSGNNWFSGVQGNFLFPFNLVPVDVSWFIATWFELIGAIALLIGLGTRFFSFSLIILSVVAIFAVHWPDQWSGLGELWKGYAITNKGFGNYKLPLLFIIMLIPLVFNGAGKASIDHFIRRKFIGK